MQRKFVSSEDTNADVQYIIIETYLIVSASYFNRKFKKLTSYSSNQSIDNGSSLGGLWEVKRREVAASGKDTVLLFSFLSPRENAFKTVENLQFPCMVQTACSILTISWGSHQVAPDVHLFCVVWQMIPITQFLMYL